MRFRKTLSALALLAALAGPVASFAAPDDHDHDHRYYDRVHRDYHHWDAREDAAYRHWLAERHRHYVEFARLRAEDQRLYWQWRHDHPNFR